MGVRIGLLVTVYFVAGKLGLLLAYVHASATPVWPPTGIALAALLVWGYRVWPGIFLGALLVNLTTPGIFLGTLLTNITSPASVASCLGIAAGNTLEAVVGAALVMRWANGRRAFERPRDVFLFTLLAAMVSTTVSASCGAASLCLAGSDSWENFRSIWFTWWLGDAVGALLVAPPLILWNEKPRIRWNRRQLGQAVLVLLVLVGMGQIVFGWLGFRASPNFSLAYACLLIFVWTAYQFGQRETATATLILAWMALVGTLDGLGPFITATPGSQGAHESLLNVQLFMGITAVTALFMGAVVGQYKEAAQALRRTGEQLEQRVRERTAILAQTNDNLRREIADRRQAELALRDSEQRNRTIIETAFDAFVGMDADGLVTDWNAQAEATFGWRRQECLGQPLAERIIPLNVRAAQARGLRRYLDTGAAQVLNKRIEVMALHRDGYEFPVEVSIWPAPTRDRFFAFVRDIRARKETEEKLRQAERLAAIGEMFTALAHESRNTLQQSQACLELLGLKISGSAEVFKLLEDVQKAQDHLHQLYEVVRGYAAPVKLQRQPTDLGELLKETWQHLELSRQGRHMLLEQSSADLNLNIEADRLALGQVFRNILENSLNACADPVEIRVHWSEVDTGGRRAVQVSLRDNGPGLAPEARHKLFEPFFTTTMRGTGLGLAIARRIVQAHGGHIAAGTNQGTGTEIVITLPRQSP